MTSLTMPDNLKFIGAESITLKLTQLYFNEGLQTIEAYAFRDNLLTSLEIPSSVTTIGELAFRNSPLEEVRIHGDATRFNITTEEMGIPSTATVHYDVDVDFSQMKAAILGMQAPVEAFGDKYADNFNHTARTNDYTDYSEESPEFIIILDSSEASFSGTEDFSEVFTTTIGVSYYKFGSQNIVYIYQQTETELIEYIGELYETLLYYDFSTATIVE